MNTKLKLSAMISMMAIAAAAFPALAAEPLSLTSPDGKITFTFEPSKGEDSPTYAVSRYGETVISSSPLGIDLLYTKNFGPFDVVDSKTSSADNTYPLIATKAATARDHYNELSISLVERTEGRKMDLIVRAYDDGVAFRYVLPQQPQLGAISIANERTQFNFPDDYNCWGLNVGSMESSHEGEYELLKASMPRWYSLFDPPFTCKSTSGKTTFVLTEADLKDYSGLYLRGRMDGGYGMQAQLSLRYDDRRIAVRRDLAKGPVVTPWRVVMMADHAGDLIPSTLIGNLNPQSTGKDTSWIKAGKAAWDWWPTPYVAPPKGPGMTQDYLKYLIDFAQKSNLPYLLIDEGWSYRPYYEPNELTNADILRTKPGIDMPALVQYAKERNVDLMLWVQWDLLNPKLTQALDVYQAWGIKGIKIDFMTRDDQDMIDFYHRVMEETERRHMVVDMHAAYHPTGLNRTYPHFLTQEGVMGAENNKWSVRVTAQHNVTIPFTRMLLGPMDYTPGGFGNVAPKDFVMRWPDPVVKTTRAQNLAMFVVYESPLQMVADSPKRYENAAGFDFIKEVPASWDETRFIAGDIGDYIVMARRKGTDWYIGAMTDKARTVDVPLAFLSDGKFSARIWQDGKLPAEVVETSQTGLGEGNRLRLKLASTGGAVVQLTPATPAKN
ncbi:glycoside hydrolase family 97 protein [Asticcacaulis sp.]|uniref:glycoside hydrolase family 97 protein n=1 Tax=Asticcacaulis sp. TaxID=1872648 RepID=UPI002B663205|nr:glycoside hydrolase family 97 protein [Asticcacaulis sp.]HTM81135.1 glycoside hydrolase family 97 protein [Asticcacaulis sp.]